MIRFQCPHCRKSLSVGDALAGRVGACPGCKNKVQIPRPEPEPEELEEVLEEEERYTTTPARKSPPARAKRPPADDDDDRRVTAQKPRRPRDDEDDDRPAARRRRRDEEDDDDYDDDRPRRRPGGKRKKKRRRSEPRGLALPPAVIGLIVVGVVGILFLGLMFVFPPLAIAPLVMGWGISIICGIWILVIAFQESPLEGILCLFVPFYSLFFTITHWAETKVPFLASMLGSAIGMIALCAGGFGAAARTAM